MYTLINIKKLFKNNLILNFTPDKPSNSTETGPKENDFKGDGLQDLKKLKEYLKNGLTSSEAEMINKHMDEIQEEAKLGLKEIAGEMLSKGFSAINEKTYNSFKNIIEKNTNTIIPSWQTIIDRTIENSSEFSTVRTLGIKRKLIAENFHGVTIKNHIIEVKYDGVGTNDTLRLSYNKSNGKLSNHHNFNKWIETENEEEDVNSTAKIDETTLDDNIQSIIDTKKQKETFRREEELLKKAIDTINNYDIKGKTEKEFETFIDGYYQSIVNEIGEENINNILSKHLKLSKDFGDIINKKFADIRKQNQQEKTKNDSELNKEKIDKAISWYKGKPKKSIQNLQELINKSNNPTTKKLKIDGIIGKNTITEIINFQKKHNLTVDGIAGKNTLKALGAENPNSFYNKKEKTSYSSEKKEYEKKQDTKKDQEKKEVEIKYGVDKAEIIKSAMQFLKENKYTSINTQAEIGIYEIDGEQHKIVLKGSPGNYKVELDGESLIDDIDQEVLGDTIDEINLAINRLIQKKETEIKETDSYKEKQLIKKLGLSKNELKIIASDLDAEYNNLKEKDGNQVLEIDRWGTNDINIGIKNGKIFINDDSGLININNIGKSELKQTIIDSGTYLGVVEELDHKIRSQNELSNDEEMLKEYLKRHNKINSKAKLKKIMSDLNNNLQGVKEEARQIEERNNKFREILNKLQKEGIIGETLIKIDSGDYKGKEYKLNFEVDGNKLILDSSWNQPGTDKEIKINIDKVVGKTNNQVMEYINSLKNKLITEYKNQVAKQKKQKYDPTSTNNDF